MLRSDQQCNYISLCPLSFIYCGACVAVIVYCSLLDLFLVTKRMLMYSGKEKAYIVDKCIYYCWCTSKMLCIQTVPFVLLDLMGARQLTTPSIGWHTYLVLLHYYRTDLQSKPFVPAVVGPGTKGAFVRIQRLAGWKGAPGALWYSDLWSQLVPSTGPLYPLPPPPAQFNSAHLSFLLFLALVGGILAHLLTTFVKDLDFPAHPSALKVWGLFLSPFIDCVAHFMLQK